jgi:hypothetical protein
VTPGPEARSGTRAQVRARANGSRPWPEDRPIRPASTAPRESFALKAHTDWLQAVFFRRRPPRLAGFCASRLRRPDSQTLGLTGRGAFVYAGFIPERVAHAPWSWAPVANSWALPLAAPSRP